MFLSAFLLSIKILRLCVPVGLLFGSAPICYLSWFLLRCLTIFSVHGTYRRYDDHFFSLYQRFVLFFFENWAPVQIYFHGDYSEIFKQKENILYISNHRSSVDWIIVDMLALRQGSLGHLRFILKNALKWIPLYGFYFQQHGCIYVHRNDKNDLQRVCQGMKHIQSSGLPIWLIIFPEGTRFNPEGNSKAIQQSKNFALTNGFLPLKYVLHPRSGATTAALQNLKETFNAVYDITLMYSSSYNNNRRAQQKAPSMFGYLQGHMKELHIDIRRIDMNQIPIETNEQISNWLYQRFQLKDKLLEKFHQFDNNLTGQFLSDENDQPIQMNASWNETFPSCLLFCCVTLSFLLTRRGRSFYWKLFLLTTPISYLWMHFFPPRPIDGHRITSNKT